MGLFGLSKKRQLGAIPHEVTLQQRRTARRIVVKYLTRNPGATLTKISEDTGIATVIVWGILRNQEREGATRVDRSLYWYVIDS